MGVVRKSSGTVMAYDPAARLKARAWALVAYLVGPGRRGGHRGLRRPVPAPFGGELRLGTGDESGANMVRVGYANGGTFSFGFLLVNDGPLPVKIQRIQVTGQNELLVPVGLETAAKRDAGSLGEGDPSLDKFLPFTLAGGDRRWIVVRTRFGNCGRFAAGAFETYTQFKVTYSVLGFTKHAWVPLPKDIGVDSPPDYACPTRAA